MGGDSDKVDGMDRPMPRDLVAGTGMRIGEVTALQWIDIDFSKNYIIVRRNIPHHRQVETTKTVASQRKVDMSPELSEELKRLRTERKKQALADGKTFDMEAWRFRTRTDRRFTIRIS